MHELEQFKRQINLVDFAVANGYTVDKKRSSHVSVYLRHATGDRIVIATSQQGHGIFFTIGDDYCNGSIIDFVQKKLGVPSLGHVRKALRPWVGSALTPAIQQHTRHPRPEPSTTPQQRMERLRAEYTTLTPYTHNYLSQRGINAQALAHFAPQILQDNRNNACFLHRNAQGKITGWEKKNSGFTGFSSGGRKGLFMQPADPTGVSTIHEVLIFEGAIDAISFHQMHPQADRLYLAIGGSPSPEQLQMLIETLNKHPHALTLIAVDNDPAGDALTTQLTQLLDTRNFRYERIVPNSNFKDWNDEIKNTTRTQ